MGLYSRTIIVTCSPGTVVNMRIPSEISSTDCFPSKLFEYIAAETRVLSFDI